MNALFSFEHLDVWKLSRSFCNKIYAILQGFPIKEKFNLTSQIQRSSTSISLNIAEGCSRSSYKEQARFTEVAYGSLMETYCSLLLAYDFGYLGLETIQELSTLISELSNKLNALRNSQLKRTLANQQLNSSTTQQKITNL